MNFPLYGSVHPYCVHRVRQSLCFCAFLLWTKSSFSASFLDRYPDSAASLKGGQVYWKPITSYNASEGLQMQAHNRVLEALTKPHFEAIKVGSALYREIHIPESVRTYTDTPQWDQKQVNAARRQGETGRMRTTEVSGDTGEEMFEDEGGRKRTSTMRNVRDSEVAHVLNQEEQECGVAADMNAATGDKASMESVGASFFVEEGPFLGASRTKWVLKLHMKTPLYRLVVGKKGAELARIGKQHNVRATRRYDVPRFAIRMEAAERTALLRARDDIRALVEEKRETIPYTHFISLPLTDPRFQARYNIFKTQVTAAYPNFDKALFHAPEHLHITALLLRLLTDEEETRCKSVLESISKDIYDAVDTRSLVLHLKGLQLMNDDPSAAAVVFTDQYTGNEKDLETFRRLHRLCSVVAEAFRASGFVSEEEMNRQELHTSAAGDVRKKLHATLLNAKLRQRLWADTPAASKTARRNGWGSNNFDATELLCNFKLFDFFECRVPSVELVARARYCAEDNPVTVASVRLP